MTIGILKLILFIPGSNSLKEKRMAMHSLKARLRNNFNVATAQLEDGDKWQKAILAVVGVEKNKNNMNSVLSQILNFIEGFSRVNLIEHEMELI